MLPRVRIETAPTASVNSGVVCRRERWLSVTPAGISGVMPSKRIVTNVLLKVSVRLASAAVVGVDRVTVAPLIAWIVVNGAIPVPVTAMPTTSPVAEATVTEVEPDAAVAVVVRTPVGVCLAPKTTMSPGALAVIKAAF